MMPLGSLLARYAKGYSFTAILSALEDVKDEAPARSTRGRFAGE